MPSIFYQTFLTEQDKTILIIGGGGKSALIKRLAQDSKNNGRRSVIASLFPIPFPYEANTLVSKDADLIRRQLKIELEKSKIIIIGKKIDNNSLVPFSKSELNKIIASNPGDHFFIEADHTAGRSLSGLEKVDLIVPFKFQLIINVIGADALNQRRNDNWTVSRNKFLVQEHFLNPNQVAAMYIAHPKLVRIRKKNTRLIFFLNKVENLLVENLSIQLTKKLKLGGYDKVILGSIFNSNLYQLK